MYVVDREVIVTVKVEIRFHSVVRGEIESATTQRYLGECSKALGFTIGVVLSAIRKSLNDAIVEEAEMELRIDIHVKGTDGGIHPSMSQTLRESSKSLYFHLDRIERMLISSIYSFFFERVFKVANP